MSDVIPADYRPLLDLPVYVHLATIRPDSTAQVNPMWFLYDEASNTIRFTHTNTRGKFRNLQQNPSMAISLLDPDNPFRYLEVRGRLLEAIPDPTGAFYVTLQNRYGNPSDVPPRDKADRVILVMSVEKTTKQ